MVLAPFGGVAGGGVPSRVLLTVLLRSLRLCFLTCCAGGNEPACLASMGLDSSDLIRATPDWGLDFGLTVFNLGSDIILGGVRQIFGTGGVVTLSLRGA